MTWPRDSWRSFTGTPNPLMVVRIGILLDAWVTLRLVRGLMGLRSGYKAFVLRLRFSCSQIRLFLMGISRGFDRNPPDRSYARRDKPRRVSLDPCARPQ